MEAAISYLLKLFGATLTAFLAATLLPSCEYSAKGGAQIAGKNVNFSLVRVFGNRSFKKPVAVLQAPGDVSRWFVVEQVGRVRTFTSKEGNKTTTTFVDIRERVDSERSETGLLGMAFHPDFKKNHLFFLSYTRSGSPLVSYVSRFTASDDWQTADPESEQVILTLNQPYVNHNGGGIEFGPDGYLYIGFGDGGSGGDPHGNGQNSKTLLGTILRIDVNSGTPYSIPTDNPFVEKGGKREIYAYGLRNPWRFSFDRLTGDMWTADVGQEKWEEINRIENGKNYGWNIMEGSRCYKNSECQAEGLTGPVAEYSHKYGCSITGGYVYRGTKIPELNGAYIYGDYCSGRIWGLFNLEKGVSSPVELLDSKLRIASFGQGNDGELYVVDHKGGGIYKIVPRS